jgi:glycosidase
LLSFLDNHDLNRFLFEARGDPGRLRQAAEVQFAQARPPVIYYGTEMGMNQTGPVAGDHGDLQARRLMPWEQPNRALFQTYQRLIGRWKEGHQPAPRAHLDTVLAKAEREAVETAGLGDNRSITGLKPRC